MLRDSDPGAEGANVWERGSADDQWHQTIEPEPELEEGEATDWIEREPPGYALARFAHLFPGFPLVSETYPTRDKWIPAEWFDLVYGETDAVLAINEAVGMNAAAAGQKISYDGKTAESRRMVRQLSARAFPIIRRVSNG